MDSLLARAHALMSWELNQTCIKYFFQQHQIFLATASNISSNSIKYFFQQQSSMFSILPFKDESVTAALTLLHLILDFRVYLFECINYIDQTAVLNFRILVKSQRLFCNHSPSPQHSLAVVLQTHDIVLQYKQCTTITIQSIASTSPSN